MVKQVSPVCQIAGRFTVKGRAGRNRVRFPSRASRLRLDPGTYRISVRTRAGRLVRRVTIVVVGGGVPSPNDIAAARAANVCAPARSLVSTATGSTGASNTSGLSDGQVLQRSSAPASSPDRGANSRSGAVLAASIEKAARAIRPLLVALLALAIMLLGLASLPRAVVLEPRANDLLARHRVEIAGLGAAAFVAVVIAFLVG